MSNSGLVVAAAAAVVVLVAGTVLVSSSRQRPPSLPPSQLTGAAALPPSAEAAPGTPGETTAVMNVLHEHARALRARDRDAWAADLDTSSAAKSFARDQLAAFDNLAAVPLSAWDYRLIAPAGISGGPEAAAVAAASERLGARVVIARVQLVYGFAAADPSPTHKTLWITAVLRGPAWRLAGDSDMAPAGQPSWHGPWDFGPIDVRTGPHVLVLAHPRHAGQLPLFAALVEQAVPVVTGVWGTDWNQHVAVLIPDTAAEFAEVTADHGDTQDLAALAIADQVQPQGLVLGARIVFNPVALAKLDDTGRRLVIQHELTHVAARSITDDRMPDWVIEGFADYVGNLGLDVPVVQAAAELAADIRQGRLPAALPERVDFGGTGEQLNKAYEQSWLACRLIARRIGQDGLVRFYRAVSEAARSDPDTATATAVQALLRVDIATFVQWWRTDLRQELG